MRTPAKHQALLVLILSLLLITGCNARSENHPWLAVICTNMLLPHSELALFNEDGEQMQTIPLEAQGIYDLKQLDSGRLALPVRYSDEVLFFDFVSGEVEKRKTKRYPFYYQPLADGEFTIYNSDAKGDIDYLTYELRRNGEEKSLRIKGFPLAVSVSDDTALIYLDKKEEADALLFIDLQEYGIQSEVGLEKDLQAVSSLLAVKNDLLLPHPFEDELIILSRKNPKEARSIRLPYTQPHLICAEKDILIVAYFEGGLSRLDPETYRIEASVEIPYRILRIQLHHNQLYLLADHLGKRKILVLDPDNWKVEKTIEVECHPDLRIQNFLVLD